MAAGTPPSSRRLDRKTVIVTGATVGIGEAIARRMSAEGANVVLVARRRERGEALARELGRRARFVPGSVADRAVADAAIATASDLGGVDVLVNNAGMDFVSTLLDAQEEDIRRVLETNFFGALWMLMRVGRELRDRGGGAIINVTSRLASRGAPNLAIYSASKGALLALTRSAAVELARFGIRVNAVAPGLTDTPLLREWISEQEDPGEFKRALAATIPNGRLGVPEDVAATVAFLAADESSHITGASIPVDGGYTVQ